ncbi:MAG: hypothetical protein H0W97_01995 [Actinobacteria bacterium]|nr:hypothetical protein [Actinomycetota bacterium]
MKRGLNLGAIALAIAAGVAVGADPSSLSVSGLPRAMGHPDCAPGEEYSRHEIDYMYGTGYPTPRDALDTALAVGHGHLASGDFASRDVRVGDEAVREFTLERPDGSLWALAVATPGTDGGWVVSTVYECFP